MGVMRPEIRLPPREREILGAPDLVRRVHVDLELVETGVARHRRAEVPDRSDGATVRVGVDHEARNHGCGDREVQPRSAAHDHDLDVLPDGREARLRLGCVEAPLQRERERLRRRKRSEPDADARVVRAGRDFASALEEIEQLAGAGVRLDPHLDVLPVEVPDGANCLVDGGVCDPIQGNPAPLPCGGRSSRQCEHDRCEPLASAVLDACLAGAQQRLVDVVMEDPARPREVVASEIPGECLRGPVAERIRVTQPLALDDFELAPGGIQRKILQRDLHGGPLRTRFDARPVPVGLRWRFLAMDAFSEQRERMVRTQIADRGIRDPAVLAAMRAVPRERFVDEALASYAYEDRPLPIEAGQTISQPFMVATMAEALQLSRRDRVLEVGAGSGYAAAVLSRIASEVYAVEIHEELVELARSRLEALGYGNVHLRHANGSLGWIERAPFDGILVSAGAPAVPKPLQDQLAEGGRLLIPLGASPIHQVLVRITRVSEKEFRTEHLDFVAFVPLVGAKGWSDPSSERRAH
jgi:protein-L-isoaspartate(D-aspartate) O-methyltransferase